MEAIVPPGGGPPPHIHSREEEGFYVLEGEITFQLGEERFVAVAGTFANMRFGAGSIPLFLEDVANRLATDALDPQFSQLADDACQAEATLPLIATMATSSVVRIRLRIGSALRRC